MASMKHLLRLVGALALSTGAATSVVACGPGSKAAAGLDQRVAQDLELQDENGKGTQVLSFDGGGWAIAASKTPVTADKLLNGKIAKSEDSYNFITQILGVKPEKEGKWEEAEFNADDLKAITATISAINPTLAPITDKSDYAVTAGTYNLQFTKDEGKTNVGGKYSLPLKVDPATGVVAETFTALAKNVDLTDTNVGDAPINFKKDGDAPKLEDITKGIEVKILATTETGKTITALSALLPAPITAKTSNATGIGEDNKWAAGSTLTITYTSGNVTFKEKTEFNIGS